MAPSIVIGRFAISVEAIDDIPADPSTLVGAIGLAPERFALITVAQDEAPEIKVAVELPGFQRRNLLLRASESRLYTCRDFQLRIVDLQKGRLCAPVDWFVPIHCLLEPGEDYPVLVIHDVGAFAVDLDANVLWEFDCKALVHDSHVGGAWLHLVAEGQHFHLDIRTGARS